MADDKFQEIEKQIDLLLNGKFSEVPNGTCSLTTKIKELSDATERRVVRNLDRTVKMSIAANKSVESVAEMVSEISEVDRQSQSIASAVEQLAASVGTISSTAEQAAVEVSEVEESARSGLNSANEARGTMQAISGAVKKVAGQIGQLSDASEQIGTIVKEIEDIAKQTNLLALNATIEAARAGEAGRGFAVVASEVKNLAKQTATSTENIRDRIGNLRSEMSTIVTAMREGEARADDGMMVIEKSSGEMERISGQVETVNERIHEITGILSQQSQASAEVSSGVATIAQMSSQNVQGIEKVIVSLETTEGPIEEAMADLVPFGGQTATLYAAKSDHMIWMRKLAQMLAGRLALSVDQTQDHHACRLGKWYDNQTNNIFTSQPEWTALQGPHKRLHNLGLEAIKLYQQGNTNAARDKIHQASVVSEEIMTLLDALAGKLS